MKKVLSKFNVTDAKPMNTSLASHFKLSNEQSPTTKQERGHMAKVPYASTIGSLTYAMVYTRANIAYAMGVVSRCMSNLSKQHLEAVKSILMYLRGTTSLDLCFMQTDLGL